MGSKRESFASYKSIYIVMVSHLFEKCRCAVYNYVTSAAPSADASAAVSAAASAAVSAAISAAVSAAASAAVSATVSAAVSAKKRIQEKEKYALRPGPHYVGWM